MMDLGSLLVDLQIGAFGPVQVLSNLLMALFLAMVTGVVYRKTHSGFAYSRSFNTTMTIISMVVTMMMMVIGNYLALSLGLIGALSVIRFRTAVKDTKDMAYLFICIAIGLSCSTGDYVVAIVGTLVINATILVLYYLRFDTSISSDYILTFHLSEKDGDIKEIISTVSQKIPKATFRSFCQLNEDVGEYVYALSIGSLSEEEVVAIFNDEAPQLHNVSLIAPEAGLEL